MGQVMAHQIEWSGTCCDPPGPGESAHNPKVAGSNPAPSTKLPPWFVVDTPIGGYNPDWALVKEDTDGVHLYLVRETKGTTDLMKLREAERQKILCGERHFEALGIDYEHVASAAEV